MAREEKIATPKDLSRAAAAARSRRAEIVTLPSGLRAKLVRPTAGEYFFLMGRVPQSVAGKLVTGDGDPPTTEDMVRLARQTVDLCRFVFFEPPLADGVQVGIDISEADIEFALRWARGEVDPTSGTDLAEFRRAQSE